MMLKYNHLVINYIVEETKMTKKLKKIAAILLAGMLACTALVGCNGTAYGVVEGDNDYNYDNDYNHNNGNHSSGGSNSGNAQQNSQYTGLSPAGLMEALSKAEDYVITSNATMQNHNNGLSQSATMTTKVDGNLSKTYGTMMVETDIVDVEAYLDYDECIIYSKDENGNWVSYSDKILKGYWIGFCAYMHDGSSIERYIFEASNYDKTSDTRYEMHGNTLKGKLMDGSGTASGYMTSSGSTYTFVMTAQQKNTVLNFTVTIEFKSTSVTIPDSVRG